MISVVKNVLYLEETMVRLCIDHRERYDQFNEDMIPKFIRYIKAKQIPFIDDIKIVQSQVGDYFTPDNLIGIERKYKDFVSSMMSGKLDQQIIELKNNFAYPYLFIEYSGLVEMIADNPGTNPESIQGELASLLSRHNIPIIFTGDLFIPFVCKVISKHYDDKNPVKHYSPIRGKAKKRDPTAEEIRIDIYSRIPKLGKKRANTLRESSYLKLMSRKTNEEMTEDEIKNLPGFGKKIAHTIKETLS